MSPPLDWIPAVDDLVHYSREPDLHLGSAPVGRVLEIDGRAGAFLVRVRWPNGTDLWYVARDLVRIDRAPTPANVYDQIKAERGAQIAKGRDAAHDDARSHDEWMECLRAVIKKELLRRSHPQRAQIARAA